MRILKTLLAILVVGLMVAGAAGCSNQSNATPTPASTQVQVYTGTISNAVTGSATLGLAKTEDLTFEMAGYVESILVEESETVTKNQVLATLDPSDWEDKVKSLENSLSSAKRTLDTREYALLKAQRVIAAKELAKKEADIALLSAKANMEDIEEISKAQEVVDTIEFDLQYAQASYKSASAMEEPSKAKKWLDQIKYLTANLEEANQRLADTLKARNVSNEDVALHITETVFKVEQAEKAVRDAQIAIEDTQVDVESAQLDVNDAKDDVDLAQSKLDEEKALNPKVVAPFDGFITSIKASGGDEVYKGSVAMQIADPNQFEASFMVSESDIFSIKVGQSAVITVDALNDTAFAAEVTAIAPLATVSSGVVNYKVTAQITSLVPITNTAVASGAASGGLQSGGFPSGGFPTGARPSGFPSGGQGGIPGGARPSGVPAITPTTGVSGDGKTSGQPTPAVAATASTLKQGLSATVTITIEEKKNVLVVPLRAITRNSGKTTVQVVDGETTNAVEVTTGLSDDSNIEIVSGLTEGQTVIVKASSSSSSMFGPGGGMMMMR